MKTKEKINKVIGIIIQFLLIFIAPCYIMVRLGIIPMFNVESDFEFIVKGALIPYMLFILSYISMIILHELGHLIMGIKNRGYFIEFNFLFFSIYKEDKKIKFKINGSISEVAGLCAMDFPNDLKKEEFQKYCFGGVYVNFLLFIFFLLVSLCSPSRNLLLFSLYMVFMNLGLGITNLIPSETIGGMETDGMKLYRMKNEKNYICNINKMLKINELVKNGVKIKDIPEDIIYKPNNVRNKSDMEMLTMYICYIIEHKKYEEAKILICDCLNNHQNKMSMATKNSLKLSLIDIYIRTDNINKINDVYDKKLLKFVEVYSKLEKAISIYLYLYYVINNNKNKSDAIKVELEKYIEDNKGSIMIADLKEIYGLINQHFENKD